MKRRLSQLLIAASIIAFTAGCAGTGANLGLTTNEGPRVHETPR